MIDKFPLTIDNFKGVKAPDSEYNEDIENYQFDDVSIDAAYEAVNIRYLKNGGFRSRVGYTGLLDSNLNMTGSLCQTWQVKNLKGVDQTNRWLVLTWDATNGRIYDTGAGTPSTPILTVAGMKYAFVINAFGRMYISPWSAWGVPLDVLGVGSLDRVYVWNGDYVPRHAQGGALNREAATATGVTNSATAGNIIPGTHLFDVAYEYDTGWVSPLYGTNPAFEGGPSTVLPLALVCTGNKVTIANVKVGGAGSGIVARHIIMSRLVTNYDSFGWLHYEPFFAAKINDNTTTSLTFDMPDAGLVESAAYLLDSLGVIYSCVSMSVSNNRMIYYGIKRSPAGTIDLPILEGNNCILVSPPGDPERVNPYNTDNSRILIGQDFAGGVNCGAELRGINYVFKNNSTWAFQADISLDPAEWPVDLVDAGIGAFPLGISKVGGSTSSVINDAILVGGVSGVFVFSGNYNVIPISMGWWGSYTEDDFQYITILINPINRLIYCTLRDPLRTGQIGEQDFIWVGNFLYGLDYESIRWSKDEINLARMFSGKVHLYETSASGILNSIRLALGMDITTDLNVIIEDPDNDEDEEDGGNSSYYITGHTPTEKGDLYTFSTVRLRVLALANATTSITSDIEVGCATMDSNTFTSDSIAVSNGPNKFFDFTLKSTVAEKVRIKISTASGTKMMVNKLIIFAAQRGEIRAK